MSSQPSSPKPSRDKRNRHAAYFALHLLRTRDIRQAATLMKAGVKTFNAEEVCDFKEFCKLCTLASVVTASRESLKKDIIDSPEIRAQLGNDEEGKIVLNVAKSLYESKYSDFFRGVLKLISVIDMDVYVKPHCNYIVRELVVRGYTQFLRSYQSVTVENMASEFGVSPSYIDSTLASFIHTVSLSKLFQIKNPWLQSIQQCQMGLKEFQLNHP